MAQQFAWYEGLDWVYRQRSNGLTIYSQPSKMEVIYKINRQKVSKCFKSLKFRIIGLNKSRISENIDTALSTPLKILFCLPFPAQFFRRCKKGALVKRKILLRRDAPG